MHGNCKIDISINFLNHMMQLYTKVILYTTDQNLYLMYDEFRWNYQGIIYEKTYKNICHLHIFAFISCVDLYCYDTTWWRHQMETFSA